MLKGMSNKEIGELLFKSPKTIATFWHRTKKKLGVHDLFGVHHKWVTQKMLRVPDMDETPEFRAGYSQALADILNPDINLFKEPYE